MEFPRAELRNLEDRLSRSQGTISADVMALRRAIASYDELAERCVMDATEASLHIANLRARLAVVDPEWKP